jgi:hypothetical protein
MKWASIVVLCAASRAFAQDTAYSVLNVRLSAFRNPVAGAIRDDWRPGTGVQAEIGTPFAGGEMGLALGHLGYTPTSGKPAYKATLFTLSWLSAPLRVSRIRLSGGFRLTDYRMDFDDPALVAGLRTEEEVMPGAIARVTVPVARRFTVFADASYGLLMLGTRTPMLLVHLGAERGFSTPDWVRGILR